MRLTQHSNYALRMLQFCALRQGALTRIDDIAVAHGISRHHLVKIAHELASYGFLETVRGRGGGVRLGKPPEDINVGEVVRLTEAPLELVECFAPETNSCPLIGACRFASQLAKAQEAFFEVLEEITVADISANAAVLAKRLSLTLEQDA